MSAKHPPYKRKTPPPGGPAPVPQKHGGALIQGTNYGNKGGGKPHEPFREKCRFAFERDKLLDELTLIAREGAKDRDRLTAIIKIAEWGWPELKRFEVSGPGGGEIPLSHKTQLLERLKVMAGRGGSDAA